MRRVLIGAPYSQKIINSGPIAYWPLNETSGSAAIDLSGGGYNGTYNGPTLANTTGPDGDFAPLFDGANDLIELPVVSLDTPFDPTEGTVSSWVKVFSAGVWTDGSNRVVFYLGVDADNRIAVWKNSSNNTIMSYYSAGATAELIDASISSTDWIHIGYTWSLLGDRVRLFIDGVLIGESSGLGTWVGSLDSNWTGIGSVLAGSFWYGWMAHFALLSRELGPAEISDLAQV